MVVGLGVGVSGGEGGGTADFEIFKHLEILKSRNLEILKS